LRVTARILREAWPQRFEPRFSFAEKLSGLMIAAGETIKRLSVFELLMPSNDGDD